MGVLIFFFEANVPPAELFSLLLQRDLLAFLKTSSAPAATRVEFKLLRDAPTQSGVAYPKYYLWVKAFAGSNLKEEGAARVAAVDRQRFDVLQFISKTQMQATPSEVNNVFPAALVPTILSLAKDQ